MKAFNAVGDIYAIESPDYALSNAVSTTF